MFAAGGMDRFVTQKLSLEQAEPIPAHTFWWEGLDGTRVLTHFPPVDTYNAEITPDEFVTSIDRLPDHGWSTDSLMPFGHGDGGGGPTREMLERARRLADLDPAGDGGDRRRRRSSSTASSATSITAPRYRCGVASSTSRRIAAR